MTLSKSRANKSIVGTHRRDAASIQHQFYVLEEDGQWSRHETFKLEEEISIDINLPAGWSLISLPVKTELSGISDICTFSTTINVTGLVIDDYTSKIDVKIGISETPEVDPTLSKPNNYTVFMKIRDISSPPTYYHRDIRGVGTSSEKWLIRIEVPEDIINEHPTNYYPSLYWNVDEFCSEGTFRLWSSNGIGELLSLKVDNMKDTDNYQIKERDDGRRMWFCIEWIKNDSDQDETVKLLFSEAMAMYTYNKESGDYLPIMKGEDLASEEVYWIYLNEEKTYTFTGNPIEDYTKIVSNGWDMVAGISIIAETSLNNGNIDEIFTYVPDIGYQRLLKPRYLKSGQGYWVHCSNITDQAELAVQGQGILTRGRARPGEGNGERSWILDIRATG